MIGREEDSRKVTSWGGKLCTMKIIIFMHGRKQRGSKMRWLVVQFYKLEFDLT